MAHAPMSSRVRAASSAAKPERARCATLLAAIALLAIAASGSAADAIAAWTPITLGGEGGMFAQAISPIDPRLMMVTCDMGASYVTRDGGLNWEIINGGQLGFMGGAAACPPVFHPTDVNTIYAYGHKGGLEESLLISHDKGSTWAQVSDPWGGAQITALYQDRGNPALMLAGVNNGIAWSADEGRTWTTASGYGGAANRFFIDWRSNASSRTCYVGGSTGAYRSTDGGRSWSAFNAGLATANLRSLAGGANGGALALFATDANSAVWRSVDGGAWANVTGALGGVQPWQVGMAEVDPDVVYLTTNNGVFEPTTTMLYKSTDRGATWSPGVYQYHDGSGNVAWSWEAYDRPAHRWDDGTLVRNLMVSQTDPNAAIAGDWSRCVTTRDGGATWQQMTSRYADSGAPAAGKRWATTGLNVTCSWFYAISPQDPRFHYCGFSDITLLRSEDGGQTWMYGAVGIPWNNTVYQVAFDADIPGTMYCAASLQHDIDMWGGDAGPTQPGGICKSTDYGRTWTALTANGLPTDAQKVPPTSVIVDPTDRSLYASYYGDWIYRSTDKGQSWTRCACNGLFAGTAANHNLWKIRAHADGTMFALVEGKLVQTTSSWDFPDPGAVFRSTDHGATWTNIATNVVGGLPLYNPANFDVDPANSAVIYVAASNGKYPHLQWGLYKTTNGGGSWTTATPAGWGDAFSSGVTIDPADRNTVYFESSGFLTVSHDAGASWANACPTAPYSGTHGIAIDHANNALYLATVGVGALRGTLTPVAIGAVAISGVTATGATATWTTNVATTSQLEFGASTAYGSLSALDATPRTSHSVALTGLSAGVAYHVRARSGDGSGAMAISGDAVFTTGAGTPTQLPTITAQPTAITVTAGQSATFGVAASGGAPLTYQWRRGGVAIAGATAASYTTPATSVADSGAGFSVAVSDAAGTATSATATLTVVAAAASPFGGTARAIPGTIQCEDFDEGGEAVAYHDADAANNGGAYRSTGVDIRASVDAGGGYQVGWFGPGEWLQYTTSAASAGVFTASVRAANGDVGGTVHIAIDGVDVTGPIAVPNTGGWDAFATFARAGVPIAAGRHTVRLICDAGAADCNWLSFTATPSTAPPTIVTQPASASVIAGQAATFAVAASGDALTYQWRRGGAAIAGATAAAYTTPATTTADSGAVFTVVVGNVGGNATSAGATLTVVAAPNLPKVAAPYGGTARVIPGLVQAEDYDTGGEGVAYHDGDVGNDGGGYRSDDVDIRACVDAGGGWQVGWFGAGEWMQYTIRVATTGSYDIAVRVATGSAGGTVHVAFDGVDATGPLAFGNTGGYDTWTNVVKKGAPLTAGTHAMRLYCDAGNLDCNAISIAASPATTTANVLQNPGFEADAADTRTPQAWGEWAGSNGTDADAAYVESYGVAHAGSWHGTHWKPAAYEVYTWQMPTNIPNGTYTLSAWVRGSGGQTYAWMEAKDFGGAKVTANVPATNAWTQISIGGIQVANNQCTIGFYSKAAANQWIYFDDVSFSATAPIVAGQWYSLVAKHSGKCLDVSGGSTVDGANVQQWSENGSTAQQWRLDQVAPNVYTLTARCSNEALDMGGWSTVDGGNAIQWPLHGGTNQQWRFEDMGGGYYRVVNINSGKVLDVSGISTQDGANVQQWTDVGGDNQRWSLVPVAPAAIGDRERDGAVDAWPADRLDGLAMLIGALRAAP